MRSFLHTSVLAVLMLLPQPSFAQPEVETHQPDEAPPSEEERLAFLAQLGFEPGPTSGQVGSSAQVEVPGEFLYAGPEGTQKLLELTQNLPSGKELATLLHREDGYFIIFEFDPVGYVKDDEKDSLDADKMLSSIRDGQKQANRILAERGQRTLEIVGWHRPPHYDQATHNLEWAPLVQSSSGSKSVNYNVRILGRRGVMEAALIAGPDQMERALPALRNVLGGFVFKQGEDYASFRKGDRIAEYGLAALVTGGAVAVAAKSGLLGRFWKLILLGLVGLVGGLKKLFGGKSSGA
jgi:uncharacterized membrane-anchored protein